MGTVILEEGEGQTDEADVIIGEVYIVYGLVAVS